MAFPALLDACVLVPYNPANVLLYLANEKMFRPLWSARILDEVEHTLVAKLGVPPEKASKRISGMRRAFPDAEIEGYDALIDSMHCDAKDRHVLAAAVRANAELLVTSNIKDFPRTALDPYDLVAIEPDEFFLDQLDLDPGRTMSSLQKLVRARNNPPETLAGFLSTLKYQLPRFVDAVQERFPHVS
ncbi:PIN domain-containing protein [Saccharomonospora iraqiensis]|uniref:PIN domain-containing protein n=1 Tax=Saccharomonospora iraqiensis TaxID=52698 RepID=UPI00022DED63|nr:PIN domain-containing protein [Saccharomonospora iraqiensis]